MNEREQNTERRTANGKRRKPSDLHIIPWAALLVAATLPVILFSGKPHKKNAPQTQEGISYLAALEARDPAEVEKTVRLREVERLRLEMEADRENAMNERMDSLENGSIWDQFRDSAILGDSRALGFSVFDFLDASRVFADGGHTIRDIPDSIEGLKVLNPACVYLCYGLNDAGIGYWNTGEEYAAELDERLTQLQEALPDAMIVVNSILPATEEAMSYSPSWRKIPEFSSAAKALCESRGVPFVDNDPLGEEYMASMWNEDGVHLHKEFYPIWAKNMLITAITAEFS